MIEKCDCGMLVYSLDVECPYCGRTLVFRSDDEELPEPAELPTAYDPAQMRLF